MYPANLQMQQLTSCRAIQRVKEDNSTFSAGYSVINKSLNDGQINKTIIFRHSVCTCVEPNIKDYC